MSTPHAPANDHESSVDVTFSDGSTCPVRLFRPQQPSPHAAAFVIWPGFGVGGRYYQPLARELANRGHYVAIGELHGQGDSSAVATKKAKFGYDFAAQEVFPRQIKAAREAWDGWDGDDIYLICHSMGGQIGSLFLPTAAADDLGVRGMIGVGSGAPYFQFFDTRNRRRLRFGGPVMRWVSGVLGYWPGKKPWDLAGYGRQSAWHIREWSRFMETGLLRPGHTDVDYAQLQNAYRGRVLLTRFWGDDDCPPLSAKCLGASLPNARKQFLSIPVPLGHNRWAREPKVMADIAQAWTRGEDVSCWGEDVSSVTPQEREGVKKAAKSH